MKVFASLLSPTTVINHCLTSSSTIIAHAHITFMSHTRVLLCMTL
jgi:hypothetical protein